jgi:CheY-like chemotaxis protein
MGMTGSAIARPAAVLVVDDDAEIRDVVRTVLEQEGFAIVEASNGEEALELLRDRSIRIGLVLLDLLMPKMDGCVVARHCA